MATTTKAYVTGTTSATTSTGTQVFDTGVYLDTTAGQLVATTFKGALDGNAKTATSATSATSATKATQDGSGNTITSTYETKSAASAKLTEAKTYADSAAAQVKNDLLNGAGEAYDTLKELGDLINVNVDAIDALEAIAANKADKSHSHSDATTSASGFMSASDKTKLNGIATGANKTTVDSSLSTSSTNPVQNKVIATALNSATSAISTNTSSISSHSTAISLFYMQTAAF